MSQIIVYSTVNCPRCLQLKATLTAWERPFREARLAEDLLQDTDLMTELHMAGRSFRAAPVLRKDDMFYGAEELFRDGSLDEEKLRELV